MCEVSSTVDNCEDYAPNAEELESLYAMLEAGNIPELQWKFPGRMNEESPVVQTKAAQASKDTGSSEPMKCLQNDFDFDGDDGASQPQMPRVRTQGSTPKSAKKKQANFAGVMEVLKKKNAEGSS